MSKYTLMSFLFLATFSLKVLAQDSLETNFGDSIKGNLPSIGLSIGLLNYKGEIGNIDKIGSVANVTLAYQLNVSYVFWRTLGMELQGTYGTLLQNQKTLNLVHNFQTRIFSGGLNLSLHLDNGFVLPKNARIAPFLFGGVSYLSFDPKGDLLDKSGNPYYYWSDGSIRNIGERDPNADQAQIVQKDLEYETSYSTATNPFPKTALVYNVGFASDFKINAWLSSELRISYAFTSTDYLDGIATQSGNDGYYLASFGFKVNPNKIKKTTKADKNKGIDINFSELLSMDDDKDGVADVNDKCLGTPAKTAVNSSGCPIKDIPIATGGKTAFELGDSLTTMRSYLCKMYPNLCSTAETDAINALQKDKKSSLKHSAHRSVEQIVAIADKNKDGKLVLIELYDAIEQFLEEKIDLTLPELKKLIDSFFDQ